MVRVRVCPWCTTLGTPSRSSVVGGSTVSIVAGAFLIAHGVVYGLYAGQALRLFELKPGFTWPDDSWALSGLIGRPAIHAVAATSFSLVAAGFAVSGMALIAGQSWWGPLASVTAVVATVALVLLWNRRLQGLDAQGAYAILINAAIVVAAFALHWPKVAA
jgi:hypothetical protein